MRLDDQLARVSALRSKHNAGRQPAAALPPEADRLAAMLGAVCQRNRYGEHLLVRRWFAEPEACTASAEVLRLLVPKDSAPRRGLDQFADPEQWLFLDTETTGLAGGTGTYAFLVGVAWWDAGGLQLEQFFMRDHTEEHSLLLALREQLAARPVLVTFNGKSFDWPLLETRYRMTRSITARPPAVHLDLLHPARQLWRLRLPSVRLLDLERHVVGWNRGDDIPSERIPQIYFDYLRGGPAEPLASVFRHNQMDLRGLAALASRMVALLEQPEAAEGDAIELFGLSRLLRRRGDQKRARRLYAQALEAGLPAAADRAARRELALLAKRERDFACAVSLWEDLLHFPATQRGSTVMPSGAKHLNREMLLPPRRPPHGRQASPAAESADGLSSALEAYEQLAIYYEHYARSPQRAAELTRQALATLRQALRSGGVAPLTYRRLQARLEHRLVRVTRRSEQAKMAPETGPPGLFKPALARIARGAAESN